GGLKDAFESSITAGDCLANAGEGTDKCSCGWRNRKQLEIHRRNSRQGPEGADHQFTHIEAGDVLHYHAARLNELTLECGKGHADHHVASRRIEAASWSADVRGKNSSYGGAIGKHGVEWDHLFMLRQNTAQFAEPHSRFDADREVARLVVED